MSVRLSGAPVSAAPESRRSPCAVCIGLLFLLFIASACARAADPPGSVRILCYHDVRDRLPSIAKDDSPDPETVTGAELARHFAWLRANRYVPVTLRSIEAARSGGRPLPERSVLLTFDGGFKSLYTKVFPLLRQYRYPAVASLVTGWMETPAGRMTDYGDRGLPRNAFVTWPEVRTMLASGLLEVASHTHRMHRGIVANPQGNLIAAAVTRQYLSGRGAYESEPVYRARVAADLRQSVQTIVQRTGTRPRALMWPYGEYNRTGIALATALGMTVTMNLEQGANPPTLPLTELRRTRVPHGATAQDLAALLREPAAPEPGSRPLERVVHVDLDYAYDADTEQREANLDRLVDRIVELAPSTVYLQAFADPDGDGVADALYFPNRHLPMRSDLFSRAAWQLQTRAHVRVYAWMPVFAFKLPPGEPAADDIVQSDPAAAQDGPPRYRRLSPFSARARATIREIYQDLGRSANFNGVLFHDDAVLYEDEDTSPAARAHYKKVWGLSGNTAAIRANRATARRWGRLKSDYIDAFTLELAATLKAERPALLTARNLYAESVLDGASQERLGQSFDRAVRIYDFASVMAMPYMEGARDPRDWLARLLERVKAVPGALPRTVFELQSRNWNTGRAVPARVLAGQMQALLQGGAQSYGYYPDDFVHDQPSADILKHALSLEKVP